MQLINLKIKALQDEINLWTSLLYPHMGRLKKMDPESYSSYLLGRGTTEDEVSAEFAFESLLVAYGRLQDVVLAAENLWPHRKDDLATELPLTQSHPETVIEFLKDKYQSGESLHWSVKLILKRIESFDDALSHDLDPKELFAIIHRWRRALVKSAVLESPHLAVNERMLGDQHWGGRISEKVQALPPQDRKIFHSAVRRYLASDYVFPWLPDKYNPNVGKYDSLFKLAQLKDGPMHRHFESMIQELFKDGIIAEDAIHQVSQILTRIASALNQIGIYGELIDQIIYGGGQWGPDSFIGSVEPVNIIPCTDESDACREILLAFAQGRRSPNRGLKAVVRQVRQHLIRCQKTQLVIIFTDTWDPEIFAESKGDFQAYRSTNPPRTIIGVLVNGNRITLQDIN